jgi:hypothetical protein
MKIKPVKFINFFLEHKLKRYVLFIITHYNKNVYFSTPRRSPNQSLLLHETAGVVPGQHMEGFYYLLWTIIPNGRTRRHYRSDLFGYVDGQELKDIKPAHPSFFCFLEL